MANRISQTSSTNAGLVSSVSAFDTTVVVTPTTGNVTVKLNLSNANIWNANVSVASGFAFFGQYQNLAGSAFINPDGSAVFGTNASITNVGNLSIPGFKLTASPTNGYVLTSDASGNGTWQPASGGGGTPGGSSGAVQFNNSGSFGGDAANFFWDSTSDLLGLGTNTPAARLHIVGATSTIADPSGLSMSLSLESLIGPPLDSISIFYGPTTPSPGSGFDDGGSGSSYNAGDSVDGYIYSYIIDPRDGVSILSSGQSYMGNVSISNTGDTINWSGWSGGSGNYIIQIINNTQGTNYAYDLGGATSYEDFASGGFVTFSPFSGITASGYSYDFQPYNKALSPSGDGFYMSSSGGDFTTNDDSSGNQYWIIHTITSNSGTGWVAVDLYDTVSNSYFETSDSTYYQTAQSGSGGFPPYSQHYGILSDGSALNLSWQVYSEAFSPITYFSAGNSSASVSDPSDAQYYIVNVNISSIGGGTSTRIIQNSSVHADVITYPFVLDSFGPLFSGGTTVTPSGLSSSSVIAQNGASSFSDPASLEIIATSAPMISFSNGTTQYLKMGYDPAAGTSFMQALGGDFDFRDQSNNIVARIYQTNTVFNANHISSYTFTISSTSFLAFLEVDSIHDAMYLGSPTNNSSYLNFAAASTTKGQANYATSATHPASPNNGDTWFDGQHFFIHVGGSLNANVSFLNTAAAGPLTAGLPIINSSGNVALASGTSNTYLIYNGSGYGTSHISEISGVIISFGLTGLFTQGFSVSSSQSISMGNQARYTGGVLTSFASVTASVSLNQANHSPIVEFTGSTASQTLTLPTAAGNSGIIFEIVNRASVAVTVATTSSQAINIGGGAATVLTLVLLPGDRCKFVATNASSWDALPYAYAVAMVSSGNLLAQTAAVSSVATVTAPNDTLSHTYQVSAYLTIISVVTDVVQVQVTYTDENSNAQTQTFSTIGATPAVSISTTGAFCFSSFIIRAKVNTAITVKTVLTIGTGSISYDVGATITRLT